MTQILFYAARSPKILCAFNVFFETMVYVISKSNPIKSPGNINIYRYTGKMFQINIAIIYIVRCEVKWPLKGYNCNGYHLKYGRTSSFEENIILYIVHLMVFKILTNAIVVYNIFKYLKKNNYCYIILHYIIKYLESSFNY